MVVLYAIGCARQSPAPLTTLALEYRRVGVPSTGLRRGQRRVL